MDSIESTNELAWKRLKTNLAHHGDVIVANYQSKGKGQNSNSWYSSHGTNLLFSVICKDIHLKATQLPALNMAVSLAIYDFLNFYFPENTKIKWPNDLLINDKKIAGILLETSLQGDWVKNAVIGIGINVNEENFPLNLPHACSFYTIKGRHFERDELVHSLLIKLDHHLAKIKEQTVNEIKENYERVLYKKNQKQNFIRQGNEIVATIVGVNSQGKLLMKTENGLETFNNKEIEFIL